MKMKFLYCFLLVYVGAYSQAPQNGYPPISYFGIEQGLSNNAVRSIFQDSKGFMWFGTYDGLNQYDGYTCKAFRNEFSDSFSLINNWINSVNEDATGRLWVGTRKGLSIFNRNEETFFPVDIESAKNDTIGQFMGIVKHIIKGKDGRILIATQNDGLLIGNSQSTVVKQTGLLLNGRMNYSYDVQAIETISDDTYLMVVLNVGICTFDAKSNAIRLVNDGIRDVYCIKKVGAAFWIGSDKGIFLYDLPSNKILSASSLSQELSLTKVVDILQDHNNDIWIATNGNGVYVFHTASRKVDHLNAETKPTLTSNAVYRIFEDIEQRKWIGTIRGGINIIDDQKNKFTTVRQDPYNANSLASNFILSYYEAPNGNLWVGMDGGGLSIWDRTANTFSNFKNNPVVASSLSDNIISNIQQDASQNVWLCTYYGGIDKSSGVPGVFTHYHLHDPADPIKELLTYSLCVDRANKIWVGTLTSGGLYRYNQEADRFDLFDSQLKDLLVLKLDSSEHLWGGNLTQLVSIDTKTKRHRFFGIGQPVRCIVEDNQNRFWIGTEGGGLVLFDRSQNKILQRYTIQQGLCNNAVLTILPDDSGHLWMSTFNGISRFDIATGTFKSYYQNDGLQSNQFNYNAGIRLRSGEFAFGGIKGMNVFYPRQITASQSTPPLVFTDVLINNTNPFKDAGVTPHQKDDAVTGFTIPYNKAIFSFDFAALDYTSPEKITYSYYMEGWDKSWINSGTTRRAIYTHLKEGHYTFRVKCTNTEGGWNVQELQMSIDVLPPWYRSWWAYSLYALMVASGIYFYNRYRVQKARLHFSLTIANLNAEKERAEKDRERAEHEKERILNEKEKEINDKKLEFFTNIAHEFRTPLTLITNPVKELLKQQPENSREAGELKVVYGNARRMANLVDQLLLFQKGEHDMNHLQPEDLDLCAFVQEVFMSFVQLARLKQIDYQINCSNQKIRIWADRNKLEIILYNLFSNALKYTPAGRKVSCSVTETDTQATVMITDTGSGIPQEAGNKIFERYYQANRSAAGGQLGFGIGLYLVKQLVDAHQGDIGYTSNLGTGTTFTLGLLKGNTHFDPGTILVNNPTTLEVHNAASVTEKTDQEPTEVTNLEDIEEGVGKEPLFSDAKSILVIDDDAQMLHYITGIFRDAYTVHNAGSGEEGLKLAQKYLPDIIISDIRMDGMNGIEVCKTIKQDPTSGHIPVILLTGTSSNETRLESIQGGADDYILKPFENEILIARVESLLKIRTALQNYFYNEITLQQHHQKISPVYKVFIEQCIRIVEEHLEDEAFGVQVLAKKLAISRSGLFRKVKSVSGLSIISFIRFIRLRKAAEFFINTELNVNETAMQVGISDMKYFRKQFQKLFGLNPSEYISRYRKSFSDKVTINKNKFDGR